MIVDELFTRERPIYFPVYAGGCVTFMGKYTGKYDEMRQKLKNFNTSSFRIWDKDDKDHYYYYPFGLFSSFHYQHDVLKDKIGMDKEKMVLFADSGGFQVAKDVATKKWNREKALRWAEQNASITPILDIPVTTPGMTFEKALSTSIDNAKWLAENRDTSVPLKVLNVISGTNFNLIKKWYEGGICNYEFDGWAHGGNITLVTEYIMPLCYFLSKGVYGQNMNKPMIHHFFGIASPLTFVYVSWLQKCLNEMSVPVQLTFDSSTASTFTRTATFISNFSMRGVDKFSMSKLDPVLKEAYKKVKDVGCDCPVCKTIVDPYDIIDDVNYVDYYLYLWMHNVYMILRFKNQVDFIIANESERVYDEAFGKTIAKSLKIIKKMLQKPTSVCEDTSGHLLNDLKGLVQEHLNSKKQKQIVQGASLNDFFE